MKKKGNISFAAFTALIVICCGAAILAVSSSSKYNGKKEYQRLEERYVAESGIDTAVGLFLSYLENREMVVAYTKDEDGVYRVIDKFSPYIIEEIKNSEEDIVPIKIVETEARDYLAGIGFLDFINEGSLQIGINTFGDSESFKLSSICVEHSFLLSLPTEAETQNNKSKLKPLFLLVKSKYRGGEVMANIKVSELYAEREAFSDINEGETGSLTAHINTDKAIIQYENYQNYGSDNNR